MRFSRALRRGLRSLTHRADADQDVADEISHYMDLSAEEYARRGLAPDAAARAARVEIGNATVVREQVRSAGWEHMASTIAGDVRYALRRLRTNPGFTVVAVVTLAVGIGSSTAIFSAIDPIFVEPLPYTGADHLVTLAEGNGDGTSRAPTFGTYTELRARSRSFASIAASDRWQPSITGTDTPERLEGARVSSTYFRTLGVTPAVGRDFADAEDQVGGPHVVILSDRIVRRRFGGNAAIIGQRVMLDDNPYLVIGVMPAQFVDALSPTSDIWAPLQAPMQTSFNSREWGHHYQIVARLAAGASIEHARQEMLAVGRTPSAAFPRPLWANMQYGMLVRSLKDEVTGAVRPAMFAIAGAVLVLLIIACVNVTNLLIARGARRRGEFAMRVALGAGRSRLLSQLLTESMVLALVGGALGLFVARLGVRALVALAPAGLPRIEAIGMNARVFAFAAGTTLIVGLIVGLVPALGAARQGLNERVRESAGRASSRRAFVRGALVVAEVALALVLLTSAGLLLRSLERLFGVSPGFQPHGLVTMQVIEASARYRSDTAGMQLYESALETVRHLPGVSAAAFTSQLPLSGELDGYGYEVQSRPTIKPGEDGSALRYAVTPGYFETMGIPLRRGRTFDRTDRAGEPEVIVVSESFARHLFGDRDPIGQRVRFGPEAGSNRPWDMIVGVVADVKQQSLAAGETEAFYVPMSQWSWVDNVQSLVVRTSGDAASLVPSIKRAIWSIDAGLPIQRVATMDGLIAASASQRRFALVIIESFALSALVLATVGLYGVVSGSVTERWRELGIRTALGATSRDILSDVVGRGAGLAGVGIAIGLLGSIEASRWLESMLFGVSRIDAITYVGVSLLLAAVAVMASWVPARRAAAVDPSIALRTE